MALFDSRETMVGAMRVRRALPRRGHRTVGAWCFADHMGPASVTEDKGIDIGPHPHMGLQTVTWLAAGEVLHRDSLGSEQVIKPGRLNLMTAGRGVSHSEEATGSYSGELHGIQLWVAQPSSTRWGEAAFEHHAALPKVELDGGVGEATALVGSFAGVESPARRDTDHFGVELLLGGGACSMPLRPEDEHAVVVLAGSVDLNDGVRLEPGRAAYMGPGRDELSVAGSARVMLLGGVPFDSEILMWWNFVARTTDEMDEAYEDWEAGSSRFGVVASALPRIPAPRERLWKTR